MSSCFPPAPVFVTISFEALSAATAGPLRAIRPQDDAFMPVTIDETGHWLQRWFGFIFFPALSVHRKNRFLTSQEVT